VAAAVVATLLAALCAPAVAGAGPLFGTWSPGEPYAGSVAGVDTLERATGRRVAIVNWYQNWGGNSWITSVQSQAFSAVTGSGRLPLLTWEPSDPNGGADQPAYSLSTIVAGTHDDYIATFARNLRDLNTLVYLRPMHEMNGNWYPWGVGVNANTPALFIQAWQRIHQIFAREGATNVMWVWSPNNFDVSSTYPLEAFYPGAAYVDVLAADGYNWGSARPQWGGWRSFNQVFRGVYDRLRALGTQPIWFAEVASAPDGGDKPAWVRDMFARAQTMDRLQAIVWFNELKELDWRANADPAVAAAFTPLPPGAQYPLLPDDIGAGAGAALAGTTPAGASGTGGTAAADETGDKAKRRAAANASDRADGAGARAGSPEARAAAAAAKILRVFADKRVRAGRRTAVRWEVKKATRVKRWIVYLDGHRIHSVRAGARTHRLRRRVRSVGRHYWRVEGRDARNRKTLSAGKSFRVVARS
jgi:hypothetical protein